MRSVWKFPYVNIKLLINFLQVKYLYKILIKSKKKEFISKYMIKVWDKSTKILSIFVGFSFLIYNGKKIYTVIDYKKYDRI